jgi:hypothetical protein
VNTAVARVLASPDGIAHASWESGNTTAGNLAHIALHDPAFTLRLVEGLREVVALHHEVPASDIAWSSCGVCMVAWPCPTLAALTRALADEEEG